MATILTKIFGSRNDRLLGKYRKTVARINALEKDFEQLSDEQIPAKTAEFRERVAKGETLDAILPEAFALVREASKRIMKMRHFDVQMIGGLALHEGKIAEMRTGEGKTLTATLPVYLNALSGNGVHVVTVNDYLANRDAQWMGRLYNFLGLTVGVNLPQMPRNLKQEAYAADITYGTNNEFGFDYLRDNMVYELAERVQRPLNYAIVDEVDSILIDEARTPLIISGQAEDQTETYLAMNKVVPYLTRQEGEENLVTGEGVITPGDFTVDEKAHQVYLTEQGHEHAEEVLAKLGLLAEGSSLYDPANISLMHHLYAALRANHLYHRDQHYVVQQGENGPEIVIVDEFTGRLMAGRRWSDGLHQAVEAKEGVPIQAENQTLASITFQNYFRLYTKLSGMTGTADTEAYEFQEIYGLETVVIPPNRPSQRTDQLDRVYKTTPEKYKAAIDDIRECYERGQPVLVGTTSIENSEIISGLLKEAGLPHQVLNAKQHEREAEIVVQAGRPHMITIATNMAGRGTDIVLGGSLEKMIAAVEADASLDDAAKQQRIEDLRANWQGDHEKVKELGGLRIIATERHESRRIDNQLRGRSGRQGDPGSSRFYLSLEDNLMRIFASDWVQKAMRLMGMKEDDVIEDKLVSRQIEKAQRKVEAHNFDIRKNLLDFDDVNNDQRKVIYAQRNDLLEADSVKDNIDGIRGDVINELVTRFVPPESVDEQWDLPGLEAALQGELGLGIDLQGLASSAEELDAEGIEQRVQEATAAMLAMKEGQLGEETTRALEKHIMLNVLDQSWKEHLARMDYLRQGIHLRGYAQKQPKQEYKKEAFELFSEMLDNVKRQVVSLLARVRIRSEEEVAALEAQERAQAEAQLRQAQFQHAAAAGYDTEDEVAAIERERMAQVMGTAHAGTVVREEPKVGRNDPCPCGSGKKYKHCHGQIT